MDGTMEEVQEGNRELHFLRNDLEWYREDINLEKFVSIPSPESSPRWNLSIARGQKKKTERERAPSQNSNDSLVGFSGPPL